MPCGANHSRGDLPTRPKGTHTIVVRKPTSLTKIEVTFLRTAVS